MRVATAQTIESGKKRTQAALQRNLGRDKASPFGPSFQNRSHLSGDTTTRPARSKHRSALRKAHCHLSSVIGIFQQTHNFGDNNVRSGFLLEKLLHDFTTVE